MLINPKVGDYIYIDQNRIWLIKDIVDRNFDRDYDKYLVIMSKNGKNYRVVDQSDYLIWKPVPKDANGNWLFVGDKVTHDFHGDIIELTIDGYHKSRSELISATDSASHHQACYYACTVTREDSNDVCEGAGEVIARIERDVEKLKKMLKDK